VDHKVADEHSRGAIDIRARTLLTGVTEGGKSVHFSLVCRPWFSIFRELRGKENFLRSRRSILRSVRERINRPKGITGRFSLQRIGKVASAVAQVDLAVTAHLDF
jgi:hypothetical protein